MPDNTDSDNEFAAFRDAMRNVTPLKQSKKAPPSTTSKHRDTPVKKPKPYLLKSEEIIHLSNHYTETVEAESLLKFHLPSLPHNMLLKLRKGQLPMQARLDLHGYTLSDAQATLCRFIKQQCHMGNRYVLIIHGKGGVKSEAPILKNHVNHWLPQLPDILAFYSALPRDGGAGAIYVWLRK